MEDMLSAVEQGQRVLTAGVCDRLYQGLDAVRKIAHHAVTGEDTHVSVFHALAQLMAEDESDSMVATHLAIAAIDPETEPETEPEPDIQEPDPQVVDLAPTESVASHSLPTPHSSEADTSAQAEMSAYQIETVRVESAKLDTLITQASELAVTKLQISQRVNDIAQIGNLWERWTNDISNQQSALEVFKNQFPEHNSALLDQFHQHHQQRLAELGAQVQLFQAHAQDDSARLDLVANQLETGIRNLRMLPISGLYNLFPRMVRDLAKQQNKKIDFVLEGADTQADKHILEQIQAPLTHLLRNAIDHGIETTPERLAQGKPATGTIRLRAFQLNSNIVIELTDDGRGLDPEKIRQTALRRGLHTEAELANMTIAQLQGLIFTPGFSTRTQITEVSGRGVGLDVVWANVARLKGTTQVRSSPNQGCTFQLTLSSSLTTTSVLIVEVNHYPYALPLEFVEQMISVERQQIFTMEGQPTITHQGQPLSVLWLSDLLELPITAPAAPPILDQVASAIPCVILQLGAERLGVFVDDLLDQQDIVFKPQSKLLQYIRKITGATILGNGDICMVLNPQDFLQIPGQSSQVAPSRFSETTTASKVLLVEDSVPIRTQVKRILEGAGYQVTAAVDGLDGFEKLQSDRFDAVVSDVEMPNLNGLELATQIRQHQEYRELPIVLVTTLAKEEDKRRGAEAGANAYLTKGNFDQTLLIDTLRRLI